jgi:hypothetical protein
MRSPIIGSPLFAGIALFAALIPQVSEGQVYLDPTPVPTVNASREPWQLSGEAIFYKGDYYYPTGPTEFFDGKVMSRTVTLDGIPLYEDSTRAPFDVVFVPVGGKLMKPYERRHTGRLAGTTGSRAPSFPVEPRSLVTSMLGDDDESRAPVATDRAQWDWPEPVAAPEPAPLSEVPAARPGVVPGAVITAVPRRDTTNAGAYVQFEGARYVSSGRAVVATGDRFVRIGDSGGAAVYREGKGRSQTIYLEAVPGGPLAPYTRR